MKLKKREIFIGLILGLTLLLWLAYSLLLEPYLAERTRLHNALTSATKKLDQQDKLLANEKKVGTAWVAQTQRGVSNNAATTSSQTMAALFDWAQSSRIDMQALKPDRMTRVDDFQQIRFQGSCVGTMANLSRFLYLVETSSLPVKLEDVRINARREGSDDLMLQFSLVTIFFDPQENKPKRKLTTDAEDL